MARNIEIKARIESIQALVPKVAQWANDGPEYLEQDDTFFPCASGRLKLRAFPDGSGILIFYRRANAKGPKQSFYEVTPTDVPDALRATLSLAYGQAGRVRKHRTLFTIGRTRVHLDCVEGLGDFLELEVVLEDDDTLVGGEQEAHAVMNKLGIAQSQLVEDAYVDLLAHNAAHTAQPQRPL